MRGFALLCTLCIIGGALAKPRTLILASKESEAQPLKKLLDGHDVTVSTQNPASLTYKKYGESEYDNIVLFGVSGDIDAKKFLDFVDSNNNAIIVARPEGDGDDSLPEGVRDAAIECGVFFSDSNVVDTIHNTGKKEEITTASLNSLGAVFPGKAPAKITYKGLSLKVEAHNPLIIPFATAEQSAYVPAESDDEESVEQEPFTLGTQSVLAAGLQTRLGSRMAFIGSTQLFNGKSDANTQFAKGIVDWTFGVRGHLRQSNVKFGKISGDHQGIRIRDELEYSVKIEERVNGVWVPYKANDVQLEFTMIDPYVRQALKYDAKLDDGTYSLRFTAPDVYGIFKFVVDYRRPGYTILSFQDQATVRPLRLNEYDRFIGSAYPYYAGVFSCYAAFFIFIVLVLNSPRE